MRVHRITIVVIALLAPGVASAGYDFALDAKIAPYPPDGAVDVPLNTVLLYAELDPAQDLNLHTELSLADEHGLSVPLETVTSWCPDSWVLALQPTQDLEPLARYTASVRDTGKRLATFTTGNDRDTGQPTFSIRGEDPTGLDMKFEGSPDIVLISAYAGLDSGLGYLCVARTPSGGRVNLESDSPRGHDWPDTVTLKIVDRAGNVTVRDVAAFGCGCTLDGGSPSAAPFALIAALFLSRRRRRTG